MGSTLIQNTREAFAVRFVGNGNTDYTLAISATLKVRRDATTTTEDWVMTITSQTTTLVVASFAPTASGVGSVTTSGEVLHMRGILGFTGGAAYDIRLEPEIVVTVIAEVSGG